MIKLRFTVILNLFRDMLVLKLITGQLSLQQLQTMLPLSKDLYIHPAAFLY